MTDWTPAIRGLIDHQLFFVIPLALLELALRARLRLRPPGWPSLANNVGIGLLHFAMYLAVTGWVLLPLLRAVSPAFGLFQWPSEGPWVWGACLLATDFFGYWLHRTQHRVRWLWMGHSVHHSAAEFNYTVGPRLGMLEALDHVPFMLGPAVLGFDPEMIVLCLALIELWSFLSHTDTVPRLRALPWFEWAFNTPANHRLHHALNPVYLDRNFGDFTMFWDHLFGTFVRESEPVVYGAVHMPPAQTPWACNAHEPQRLWRDWRCTRGMGSRLRLLAGPPGRAVTPSKAVPGP